MSRPLTTIPPYTGALLLQHLKPMDAARYTDPILAGSFDDDDDFDNFDDDFDDLGDDDLDDDFDDDELEDLDDDDGDFDDGLDGDFDDDEF